MTIAVDGLTSVLVILSICFFLGGLFGIILAANVAGDGSDSLSLYLTHFVDVAGTGEIRIPALLSLLWEVFRWPLLTLLLGFTAIGVIGIPVLFAARGFFLAFSIATFVRVFGAAGDLLAFLLFGVTGLISLPVLFVLGTQGMGAAAGLAGGVVRGERAAPRYDSAYLLRVVCCMFALCVCVLIEYLAVPALLSGASGIVS